MVKLDPQSTCNSKRGDPPPPFYTETFPERIFFFFAKGTTVSVEEVVCSPPEAQRGARREFRLHEAGGETARRVSPDKHLFSQTLKKTIV